MNQSVPLLAIISITLLSYAQNLRVLFNAVVVLIWNLKDHLIRACLLLTDEWAERRNINRRSDIYKRWHVVCQDYTLTVRDASLEGFKLILTVWGSLMCT